jgi:hypothetical protein
MGLRTGLDDVVKRKFLTLPGLEARPLCPARSQYCTDYAIPAVPVFIYASKILNPVCSSLVNYLANPTK